jgi:hypothetical protein
MWRHVGKRKSNHRSGTTKSKNTEDIFICMSHHVCDLNGHKMIDCPKFVDMQKMFHGKFMTISKVQPTIETQTIIANVNVVDVNVTTRSKVTEKLVFKNRELKKVKNVVD